MMFQLLALLVTVGALIAGAVTTVRDYAIWLIGVICGLWGDGGLHRATWRIQSTFAISGENWGRMARVIDAERKPVPEPVLVVPLDEVLPDTIGARAMAVRTGGTPTQEMRLKFDELMTAEFTTTAVVVPIGGHQRHVDAVELEGRAAA